MGLDLEANPNPVVPHLLLLRSELTVGAGEPVWTGVLMRDETRMTAMARRMVELKVQCTKPGHGMSPQ